MHTDDIAAVLSTTGQLLALVGLGVSGFKLWLAAPREDDVRQSVGTATVVASASGTARIVGPQSVEERLDRLENSLIAQQDAVTRELGEVRTRVAKIEQELPAVAEFIAADKVEELARRAGWDAAGVHAALKGLAVTVVGLALDLTGTITGAL